MKEVNNPKRLDGIRVVNDFHEIANALANGETIAHFEFGNSMSGILESGQYVKLSPLGHTQPKVGDVVFAKVGDSYTCHMALFYNQCTKKYGIGSTAGHVYCWSDKIIGIGTPMEYKEPTINMFSPAYL